jgi:hypothetical protein
VDVTLADFINSPHEIEYEGKTYHLKELSIGGKARFQRFLERRAREDAARSAEDMPADVAELYMAGCRRDIAAGAYEWGTVACFQALQQSPEAQRYAIYLTLSECHPEVDEELAGKIWAKRQQEIRQLLIKQAEAGNPKLLAALQSIANIFAGPQSFSAIPPLTGNRGNSKRQRKRKSRK